MRKLLALAAFLPTLAIAANPLLSQPELESMVRLPAGSFNMVKDSKTGKTLLVSDNARYFITEFKLVDAWHNNAKITTPERLTELASKLQPSMIPFDQMLVVDMNKSDAAKTSLTAFVDPNCHYCHQLWNNLKARTEVHTRFVILPLLGDDSETKTKRLSCAIQNSKSEDALQALLSDDYNKLPQAADCNTHDRLRANLITAQVMGVTGVPFLIASDGRFNKGLVPDVIAFANNTVPPPEVSPLTPPLQALNAREAAAMLKGKKP